MRNRAALWLLVLGPFFFASYAFANWFTSMRHDVPSVVFGWEHNIPFLAWTIVPYWSTDLFYAASLFLCRTRNELDTHAKRLLAVQILSVAAFLICPLRFSFERPPVHGFFGDLFGSLMAFDMPFNQAPSLHVGIGAVLWTRYSAHMKGFPRALVQAWLVLAGVSTLTTYQHHFIDLPTGVAAGLIAISLFPMEPFAVKNLARQLSAVYFAGSSLLAGVALRPGAFHFLLLWPACALLVPAFAYAGQQPFLFRKRNFAMNLLLAPYLAGAWLNSRLGSKPAIQHVDGNVWIGRAAGRSGYSRKGFRSVVDVTAEFPVWQRGCHYRSVPMLDLIPPTATQLRQGAKAIEELEGLRPTVVYCALGYSRSAAVVATWLVTTGRAPSASEAVRTIRERRPRVVLDNEHVSAIEKASSAA